MLYSLDDMLHSACIQHLGPRHSAEPMYCAHPLSLGCCFLGLAAAPPTGTRSGPSGSLHWPLPCRQPTVVTAPALRPRIVLHRAGRMLHRPAAGLITKQHSPSSWHIEHHELYPSTVASQDRCAAQIWAHSPNGTLLLTACGTRLWAGCDSSSCDSLVPAAGPLPFALARCSCVEDDEVPRPDPCVWDPLTVPPEPFFFFSLLPWITHA